MVPRTGRLTDQGHWLSIVAYRDMQQVGPRDDRNRREIEWDDRFALGAALDELVAAELAEHLPGEYVRLLARLDLWAFDDDDVEW